MIGYWTADSFTGAMASGTAQTFQAGGEIQDTTRTWVVPMGNGATPSAGYQQAAYVRSVSAWPYTGSAFTPMGMQVNGSPTNVNYWNAAPGQYWWSSYFYYGNMPNVFWNQNYGYTLWSPIHDWASGSYKGECGIVSSVGEPVTGVSSYVSGSHQAHAVLCGYQSFTTTGSSCNSRPFDPGNNQGSTGRPDWDSGYYKADCRNSEYVSGVAQSLSGAVDSILRCPGGVTHSSCAPQTFYGQNASAYYSNGNGDFDWGYDKGVCPSGEYVAGISAVANGANGVVGAPHAIWCCSP